MNALRPPSLDEIHRARDRIEGLAVQTPLLEIEPEGSDREIFVKLENLQPIGSFKIRGAANAIRSIESAHLCKGVSTASAGNMALGVAWVCRQDQVACRVLVPSSAPRAKLQAIERFGAELKTVAFEEWWQAMIDHGSDHLGDMTFVHPVSNADVIAGNATVGLEIADQLSTFDAVVVPFGGGGLSCGIAAALRWLRPTVPVFAVEVETAAPLAASLAAGEAVAIDRRPSFVDGIGGNSVLSEMWPLATSVLAGSIQVTLEQTAAAIETLVEKASVVAEGAGAASVAAALSGAVPGNRIVCVVSGGNLESAHLSEILAGRVPGVS